jgi:ubiquinone biosynthesis protein COQ4
MMYRAIITQKVQQNSHIAAMHICSNFRTMRTTTTLNNILNSINRRQASNNSQYAHDIPFYGLPRQPGRKRVSLISPLLQFGATLKDIVQLSSTQSQTVTDFVKQSLIAIRDPTRADAVAAVGEMTGRHQLLQLVKTMQQHPVGQQILRDRPIVSKATIPYDHLIEQAQFIKKQYGTVANIPDDQLTFGIAYGLFLLKHGFDPDERDDVKYLSSTTEEEIAYVMLRYRQCHDYWHVLTGLPPTVKGEIGLKLLELFHLNMPVAALSCLSQSAVILSNVPADPNMNANATHTTNIDDLHTIWNLYLPWASQQARNMEAANVSLLNVYYEHEFSVPLNIMRQRLQLQSYK